MPQRSRRSRLSRALVDLGLGTTSALAAFALVNGCGTSAQGVEECRDIERARCVSAQACGIVSDADECERFYRDHCLHGLPAVPPQRAQVDACVSAIQMLGTCVQSSGREATVQDCYVVAAGAKLACEAIQYPERVDACSFLTDKPVTPAEGGQGGQGGQGG